MKQKKVQATDFQLENFAPSLVNIRKEKGLTQVQMAELLGIKRSVLANYESGQSFPDYKGFMQIVHKTDKNPIYFYSGLEQRSLREEERGNSIPIIDQMAIAGWPSSFKDPEFYYNQPTVTLPWPEFKSGEFVLIQVAGDSMHPTVFNGDWLFCRHIKSPGDVRFGQVYVLIMREGVVCKRLKKADDPNMITLVSDNLIYDPYEVLGADILGVWEVKYKMTAVLSVPGSNLEGKFESLEKNVAQLKSAILADKKKK